MKESPTRCDRSFDFQAYLDGDLPAAARAELERHVGTCPSCRATLAALRRVDGLVAKACRPGPEDRPHPARIDRVMTRILGTPGASTATPASTSGAASGSLWDDLTGWRRAWPAAVPLGAALLLIVVLWGGRGPSALPPRPASPPGGEVAVAPSDQGFRFAAKLAVGSPGKGLLEEGQAFIAGEAGFLRSGKRYEVKEGAILLACTFAGPGAGPVVASAGSASPSPAPAAWPAGGSDLEVSMAAPARFIPGPDGLRLEAGTVVCTFRVAHPVFTVTTPYGKVEALGTRFRVEIRPGEAVVQLEDGKLRLSTPRDTTVLTGRQRARLRASGEIETGETGSASSPPRGDPVPGHPGDSSADSLNQSY